MYKEINELMEEFLDELLYDNKFDEYKFEKIMISIMYFKQIGCDEPLELNSAQNFDYMEFVNTIFKYIENEKEHKYKSEQIYLSELKNIKYRYNTYKRAMITDSILDTMPKIEEIKSKYTSTIKLINMKCLKKPLVYLDYNVIVECDNNHINKEEFMNKKDDITFCYSSVHLEEIYKKDRKDEHIKLVNLLEELTDGIGCFRYEKRVELCYEKPICSYNRIKMGERVINENIEKNRLIVNREKDILKPEYKQSKHTSYINNVDLLRDTKGKEIFDNALRHYGMQVGIEDLQKISNDLTQDYIQLNTHIYAIMNALMLLSYKSDKGKKDIKSGVYDIEHLIYASKCDFFITKDKNLAERAIIVYELLNLNVKVIKLNSNENISGILKDIIIA